MTNLTVTKEKAVELKLAGWGKECEFVFAKSFDDNNEYTGDEPECIHRQWINYTEMEKAIICDAPTITELLSEMDNETIMLYMESKGSDYPEDAIDICRSPDSLADCWILGKREGLIK